jgi:hypothetical protein
MLSNKGIMWISLFSVRVTYSADLIHYSNSALVQIIEIFRVFFSISFSVISLRYKYHLLSFVLKCSEYNLLSFLLKELIG